MASPFCYIFNNLFQKNVPPTRSFHSLRAEDNKNYYEELLEKDLSFSLYTIYYIQLALASLFLELLLIIY